MLHAPRKRVLTHMTRVLSICRRGVVQPSMTIRPLGASHVQDHVALAYSYSRAPQKPHAQVTKATPSLSVLCSFNTAPTEPGLYCNKHVHCLFVIPGQTCKFYNSCEPIISTLHVWCTHLGGLRKATLCMLTVNGNNYR